MQSWWVKSPDGLYITVESVIQIMNTGRWKRQPENEKTGFIPIS